MRIRLLLGVLFVGMVLCAVPSFAQMPGGGGGGRGGAAAAPQVTITGTVQSFSGNDLVVKPAADVAVWISIPSGVQVDRNAVKPGVAVSVVADKVDSDNGPFFYVARSVTVQN